MKAIRISVETEDGRSELAWTDKYGLIGEISYNSPVYREILEQAIDLIVDALKKEEIDG